MNLTHRPKDIAIERENGTMNIEWADGEVGEYPLRWLRANCPCATCKEARRQSTANVDMLQLNMGPAVEPSTEVARAELVGNYAIRLEWTDGHGAGIFGFRLLREAMPLEKLSPTGAPELNFLF